MPDRVYIREYPDTIAHYWEERKKDDVIATIPHEYIRKDIVDETIKTAEDHAYFAGQEKFREKLIEWLEECKNNPIITDLQKGNIQELIDKLNSM